MGLEPEASTVAPCRVERPLSRNAGFTLPELMAIVSIMAVLALAATLGSGPERAHHLDRAASEVAEAIRFARSEALRTGDAYGVSFETSAERVRVLRADRGTSPPTLVYDVPHPLNKHPYAVPLSRTTSRPELGFTVELTFTDACDRAEVVVFDGDSVARCSDPVTTPLETGTLRIALESVERLVRLEAVTGRVTIQ